MIPETPAPRTAARIVEEVFNSVTHGLGALAALVGLIMGLLTIATPASFRLGFIIYAVSLILLLTVSSLYHALSFSRAAWVFLVLDHSSIFILIAGSYTPFIISLYDGWAQVALLGLIWTVAAASIAVNASIPVVMKRASMIFYICFGWMGLLLLPKLHLLSPVVLWLLVAGGILYTVGAIMMALNKPFFHLTWHVLVLVAAAAHFFAIIKLV
jgi:hemolysin III